MSVPVKYKYEKDIEYGYDRTGALIQIHIITNEDDRRKRQIQLLKEGSLDLST
jgi:phosphoenolpyruvate synthase/pyruvate phosphate dikinase